MLPRLSCRQAWPIPRPEIELEARLTRRHCIVAHETQLSQRDLLGSKLLAPLLSTGLKLDLSVPVLARFCFIIRSLEPNAAVGTIWRPPHLFVPLARGSVNHR